MMRLAIERCLGLVTPFSVLAIRAQTRAWSRPWHGPEPSFPGLDSHLPPPAATLGRVARWTASGAAHDGGIDSAPRLLCRVARAGSAMGALPGPWPGVLVPAPVATCCLGHQLCGCDSIRSGLCGWIRLRAGPERAIRPWRDRAEGSDQPEVPLDLACEV